MRISDWSSDVCSSDLISTGSVFILSFIALPSGVQWRPDDSFCVDGARIRSRGQRGTLARKPANHRPRPGGTCSTSPGRPSLSYRLSLKIGNAACRERECPEVYISVGAVYVKNKTNKKNK